MELPTATEYTKTDLHRDSEGLFVETLKDMISDPFNKIKHSDHASNLLSCAQIVLQKRYFCATPKFNSIVDKLWKAATAGKARVLTAERHLEQIPRMLIYACDVDGWVSANPTI